MIGIGSANIAADRACNHLHTCSVLSGGTQYQASSRLVTVEENPRLCGWGAEVVSIAAEEAIYALDGPVVRITTPHVPLAANPILEDAQTYYTSADGKKMLFLRNHGDEAQIDLRTEAHDQREDAMDRDLKTDAPGTQSPRVGIGRDTMEETDFHQQEEDRWVKDAAEELKKRALRNDYDALAIIAPPKALGVLRKKLHKETERRIVLTVYEWESLCGSLLAATIADTTSRPR